MDENIHQSEDHHSIPMTSVNSGKLREVASDVIYYTDQIVNVIFVGEKNAASWFLIDAGMPNSAKTIIEHAEERFGKGSKPEAILLTHGHFDHVGSIVDLLEHWKDVPVYAHPLEFPFLSGKQDYPSPDPSVEGGMLAKISKLYPHKAINIEPFLESIPLDGSIPGLSDWKWIHTPGHSPGHISFFRESDKLLIAGDAFVTVRQDSFYRVLIQDKEVNGPPPYLTTDWTAARESVRKLDALGPLLAVTGHGTHMEGQELTEELHELADNFDELALPAYGKYVSDQDNEL